jgi:hypothetical protein
MELESQKLIEKSLFTTDDLHHVWVTMGHRGCLKINATDTVNHMIYELAEYNNGWYHIKHQHYFNTVFLRNMKKYSYKINEMFKFYIEQREDENSTQLKTIKLTFNCFKRRFNIYIQRTIKGTKKLIWN